VLAIALAQGGNQFRILVSTVGMEPLLELVVDKQEFLPRTKEPSLSYANE
jgi:hypothetical protein